jgi:tetratricopeptide (TPR) repeat protein
MRKIIISILLVLTFFCSTAMSETAANWIKKADALNNGGKYTDPKKAIKYLSNAIKLEPNNAIARYSRGGAYDDLGQYQCGPLRIITKPSA